MIKTSVVIPNYNGIKYIADCLNSLYAAMEDGYEFNIIVVDNCSVDGSLEQIRENYPGVKLIELDHNTGFAYAVNEGIKASETEYVLLLNNDIVVDKDMIHLMEDAITEEQDAFSVSALMISMANPELVDGAGDYYCALGWAYAHAKDKKVKQIKLTEGKRRRLFSSCAGAAIYRKSVFDEIGLFDEEHFAYLEDVDVGYRSQIYGYRNYFEPEARCLHAGSGSSGSRYNEFKINLSSRNSTYLIRKNMPFLQRVINLPFFIAGFGIKLLFFSVKGFGGIYLKGLFEGIRMGRSATGESHRVRFRMNNFGHYCSIQLQLWVNTFRRFVS